MQCASVFKNKWDLCFTLRILCETIIVFLVGEKDLFELFQESFYVSLFDGTFLNRLSELLT